MRSRWIGMIAGIVLVGNVALAGEASSTRPKFVNLTTLQRRASMALQRSTATTVSHRTLFGKPGRVPVQQTLLADLSVNGSNPASFVTGDTIEIRFAFEQGEMIARMANYLDLDGDSVLTQADAQVMDRITVVDNGPMDEDDTPGVFSARVPSLMLFPVVGNYILEVSNGVSSAQCYVTVQMPATLNYSISGAVVEPPNTPGIVVLASFGDLDHGPEEGRLVAAVTDSNGAFVIPIPDYLAGDTAAVFAFDFLGVTDNYLASQPQMVAVTGNVGGVNLVMMPANAWVRVRLSDQMGNPVPGITVYLESQGPGTQARTDSNGVVVLGGMAGPGYEVRVEEEDLWPQYMVSHSDNTGEITLVPGDTLFVGRTVYSTDNAIEGTVTISGQPAVGLQVDAWSPEAYSWGYSDYNGHFSIPVYSGVENGYWVSLDWDSRPPGFFVREPNQNVLPGATDVRIELWPAPGAIYGHVTDATTGEPITDAWVEARSDSFVVGSGTDDDGYYRIPLMNGEYEVRAWAEGYLPGIDSVTIADDSVEINFALQPFSPASIEGTVRDQAGNPLGGIHVWARTDSPMYAERDAWTDSAGHYRIPDLIPGRYIVEAYGDLWARQFYDHAASWDSASYVFLEPGQTVSGIDFDLIPGGAITGIVLDAASGQPIVGAHVRAEMIADPLIPWAYVEMWTQTGPDGRYQIGGLLPGRYVVQADKMGEGYLPQLYNGHWPWEEPDTVVVSGGMYTPYIDFNLIQGCAISGWVTDTTSMPIDSARVVAERVEDGRRYETWTDEFGNFWLAPLEPGAYRLYAVAAGYDTTWYAGPDSSRLIYLELGRWELGVMIVLGAEMPTGVAQEKAQHLPRAFALRPAYPNPFNPETTVQFDVPKRAHVEIAVFDALGRRVTTLVNRSVGAGQHQTVWRGTDGRGHAVGSGVYLVVMRAAGHRFVNKVLLVK